MAALVHAQMEQHYEEGHTVYEAKITMGFTRLRENKYTKPAPKDPVDFRAPVEEKQYISERGN